jgi:hypothetical protein
MFSGHLHTNMFTLEKSKTIVLMPSTNTLIRLIYNVHVLYILSSQFSALHL